MSATPISYTATFRLSPCLKSLKPNSFNEFPATKPNLLCGSISRILVYEKTRVWGPKTRTELIRTSAFRSSDGDEEFGVIEKEAILSNGPSELRQDLMSDELESTLNRWSKWLVAALFGVVIIWKHDPPSMWAGMGTVLNTWLSVTLKHILNQERPVSNLRSDPGMPSSHAQSIFFAVIFVIISLVKRLGINKVTVTFGVLALAFGSYLSWLRVSQQFHTISQVIVGAVLGSICSILWFQSWDTIVLTAFISSLWVRIVVVLGGAGFCLGVTLSVIQHLLMDEQ